MNVARTRRTVIISSLFAAAVASSAHSAAAAYPSRPIRLIVPFAPGGGSDAIARLLAPRMTDSLGQQVIVDNRAGGNTIIGVRLVGTSPPDGHTLLLGNANFTINAALYKKLPYDPIRDFVPVAPVASVANVLVVGASVPVKSVKELIALARSKPGQLNFASPGAGTSSHMSGVLLKSMAKLEFEIVLYKGAGPSIIDVISGQVPMAVAAMSSVLPHVKAGKLRALGVTTATRSVLAPDLPTIAESGVPGYDVTNWFGVIAPRGVPAAVLKTLHGAISNIIQDPETQKAMSAQGTEPLLMSAPELERFIASEVAKWAKLGKDFNLRVE